MVEGDIGGKGGGCMSLCRKWIGMGGLKVWDKLCVYSEGGFVDGVGKINEGNDNGRE